MNSNVINTTIPLFDNNGELMEFYLNFPTDKDVCNIEFGAGINNFGKKFFQKCYLTDPNEEIKLRKHFKDCLNIDEINECHYLDYFCKNDDFISDTKKFDTIIICNPIGYGFNSLYSTKITLNSAGKILNEGGKIIVISNEGNSNGKYYNADKFLKKTITDESEKLEYNFILSDLTVLDENHIYRKDHKHTRTDLKTEAFPNEMYTLTKTSK